MKPPKIKRLTGDDLKREIAKGKELELFGFAVFVYPDGRREIMMGVASGDVRVVRIIKSV